jgi:putative peptidoglycan lipid II flippase
MTSRSLSAILLRLAPLSLLARGGEALLPVLLAAWFGRSRATDVYWFCWACFTLAGSLVFSAYQDSALIPIVVGERAAAPARLPALIGALTGNTLAYGSGLAVVVALATLGGLRLRYTGEDLVLALELAPPLALGLVALSLRTCYGAVLSAEHAFAIVPAASALAMASNLALVGATRGALGVRAIPLGALAGELVAVVVLIRALIRRGLWARPTLARPEALERFRRLVGFEVVGNAITRLNPVIDQWIAGLAGVIGGGTLLRYAGDLALTPTSILQAVLLSVLMSRLAALHTADLRDRVAATLRATLLTTAGFLVVCAAAIYVVRGPLTRIVYLHGAMDEAAVEQMTALLPWYLVGLVPFGALLVLARTHVAVQNSRIMRSMGLLNATLNLGLDAALVGPLGLRGIALATSITHAVVAVVFWWRLRPLLAARHPSAGGGSPPGPTPATGSPQVPAVLPDLREL